MSASTTALLAESSSRRSLLAAAHNVIALPYERAQGREHDIGWAPAENIHEWLPNLPTHRVSLEFACCATFDRELRGGPRVSSKSADQHGPGSVGSPPVAQGGQAGASPSLLRTVAAAAGSRAHDQHD